MSGAVPRNNDGLQDIERDKQNARTARNKLSDDDDTLYTNAQENSVLFGARRFIRHGGRSRHCDPAHINCRT